RASVGPVGARGLRADAATNRERILAAATVAVKREGEKVPLATVASDAGVGIGTLYRHFPTREALLAALAERSYHLVLDQARRAASSHECALACLGTFLDQIIRHRVELVLPLHGGPVTLDAASTALRIAISDTIDQMLQRGRRDGTIRSDVSAMDI